MAELIANAADVSELKRRIAQRAARVGVLGLGYVGLPLGLTFAEKGFPVIGFDVDPEKIAALERGESYIKHLEAGRVSAVTSSGLFSPTTGFDRTGEADALIICVPTPLTPQREPDMSYVVNTVTEIGKRLRAGQLIILESTTYPGTTEVLVRSILERSGLKCGLDFFLAFSPEREDPGNKAYSTATIPKIVGGVDTISGDLAQALYDQVIAQTVRVDTARTAEAAKLVENIFRAVNIALVNELKIVFDRMGIDIWAVLDAAATKPFGFMRFNPGPGLGGHCIPLDPFYLAWKAREFGVTAKFIELAGEVNVQMPHYVVEKLQFGLNERGRSVKGSRVLILGLSYKKDVDDTRESPAFEIIDSLLRLGATVSYHDPHIPRTPFMRSWARLVAMDSQPLTPDLLASQDAVLLVTDHSLVDYELVARYSSLVVDTRGVFRTPRANVVKA